MKRALINGIRLYQRYISFLFGPRCRYYPSCSEYAALALEKKGILKGVFLAARRLFRCSPFFPGGYDPID